VAGRGKGKGGKGKGGEGKVKGGEGQGGRRRGGEGRLTLTCSWNRTADCLRPALASAVCVVGMTVTHCAVSKNSQIIPREAKDIHHSSY